jgi:hypothetical protein
MRHYRPNSGFCFVILCHGDDTMEYFERTAIQILGYLMTGREALVDERAQIFADCFPTVPIGNS